MAYQDYEGDSMSLDPSSPFFMPHVTRYWWASRLTQGRSVLDCACGHGYGTYILSKTAKSVLGVDLNPRALAAARAEFSAPNLSYESLDVLALRDLNKTFDVITAFEVIEHIPPDTTDHFLSGLARLLNPGGMLIVSTPNHDVVLKSGVHLPEFHINNFRPAELRTALRRRFGDVQMLGQFARRSGISKIVFDLDTLNLRHSIARRLLAWKQPSDLPRSPLPPHGPQRTDKEPTATFEQAPPEMADFRFSPRHWRQAGFTVATCSRPLDVAIGTEI